MSFKAHSNLFNWKDVATGHKISTIFTLGVEKAKGLISEKLALDAVLPAVFDSLNVFPQSLDGLSGVEAFVNFASAATWKWPFAVCWRDKAVFFVSLEKNISLATTCIMLNQPGESQLSVSPANIDTEGIFGAARY